MRQVRLKYNLKKILIEEDGIDFEETFYSKYDKAPEWTPHDDWDREYDDPFDAQSNEWHEYQNDLHKHIRKTLYHHVENEPNAIHPQLTKKTESGDPIDWVDDFVEILHEPNWAFYEAGLSPEDLKYRKNHPADYVKNDHITNSRAQTWTDMFDNFYGPGTTKDKLHKWRSGMFSQGNTLAKWK